MNDAPIDSAIELRNRGLSNQMISKELSDKGYNKQQVYEALNQLNIKEGVEASDMRPSLLDEVPVPTPPEQEFKKEIPSMQSVQQLTYPNYPVRGKTSEVDVEELVETIIEEKWQALLGSLGDMELWKSKVNDEIISIKQEIIRISNRFENMQKSVLGKVSEYSQNISEVNSEVKALEKVLQQIIQPLTSNIKELGKITSDLKSKRLRD